MRLGAWWLRNSAAFLPSLPAPLASSALTLLELLAPHKVEIYAVGGSVRDFFLGRELHDLDLEIHGIAPDSFDRLMQSLGAKGVGKSFFVYKWQGIDLSLPRCESKVAAGHRGFEVRLAPSPQEAARRRDFTINALMLNLRTGALLDFFGGLEDLARRALRVVDEESFAEDSLRVLRAVRFSAQLGFSIAPENLPLLRAMEINDLSGERVWSEMTLLCQAPHRLKGFEALTLTALDQKLFAKPFDSTILERLGIELARASSDLALPHLLPLYLLWQLRFLPRDRLLRAFPAMSLKERRFLESQRRIPARVSDRFLLALSCRYPLSQWLGLYDPRLWKRAHTLGVALQGFTPSTTPSDLLALGFEGKALGEEWRQRRRAEIVKLTP